MDKSVWLVTGVAGFLGSHVVEQILNKNDKVIGIDNFSWGKKDHVELFKNNSNFELVEADIRDPVTIKKIISQKKPNYIVHLAALHFIPDAIKNPTLTVDINVKGTQSVLDSIDSDFVKVFWFASTGDVYKKTDEVLYEDRTETEPFNIYGVSKYIGEQLVQHKSQLTPNTHFIVGRIFNLIGIRETNPHILPEIMQQLKANSKLLNLGNIWPVRDYVAVQDCAKCIIAMCENAHKSIDTINVATGRGQSVQELIYDIETILGHKIEVIIDPKKVRTVERARLVASNSKLNDFIKYSPSPKLKEVLEQLLSYYKIS